MKILPRILRVLGPFELDEARFEPRKGSAPSRPSRRCSRSSLKERHCAVGQERSSSREIGLRPSWATRRRRAPPLGCERERQSHLSCCPRSTTRPVPPPERARPRSAVTSVYGATVDSSPLVDYMNGNIVFGYSTSAAAGGLVRITQAGGWGCGGKAACASAGCGAVSV